MVGGEQCEKRRAYYQAHKEEAKQYQIRWQRANPKKYAKYMRKAREKRETKKQIKRLELEKV